MLLKHPAQRTTCEISGHLLPCFSSASSFLLNQLVLFPITSSHSTVVKMVLESRNSRRYVLFKATECFFCPEWFFQCWSRKQGLENRFDQGDVPCSPLSALPLSSYLTFPPLSRTLSTSRTYLLRVATSWCLRETGSPEYKHTHTQTGTGTHTHKQLPYALEKINKQAEKWQAKLFQ